MADLRAIDAEPVDAAVIDYLEHVLERARTGTFSAVAIAYVHRDGSTGSGFSRQHNLATMIGGVEGLKAKLLREMVG